MRCCGDESEPMICDCVVRPVHVLHLSLLEKYFCIMKARYHRERKTENTKSRCKGAREFRSSRSRGRRKFRGGSGRTRPDCALQSGRAPLLPARPAFLWNPRGRVSGGPVILIPRRLVLFFHNSPTEPTAGAELTGCSLDWRYPRGLDRVAGKGWVTGPPPPPPPPRGAPSLTYRPAQPPCRAAGDPPTAAGTAPGGGTGHGRRGGGGGRSRARTA